MTNQYKQTKARRLGFFKIATLALAIAAMICCFSILAFAAEAPAMSLHEHFSVGMESHNGLLVKEYDGTTDADITLNEAGIAYLQASLALTPEELALVDFGATASFNSANVKEANAITVSVIAQANAETEAAQAAAQKATELLPAPLSMEARIVPMTLSWDYANDQCVELSAQYVWGKTEYTLQLNTASLPAFDGGEVPGFANASAEIVLKDVQLSHVGEGILKKVAIELTDPNYCAEPLAVYVKIEPVQLVSISWVDYEKYAQYNFMYGDPAANMIGAMGVTADGATYPLAVEYPENFGNVGVYDNVTAFAPEGFAFANGVSETVRVTIAPRTYTVWLENATFFGNDHQAIPTVYSLTVGGDLPADILAAITYTGNAQSACGTYAVVATLPESENYIFVNKAGETVTSLSATMEIRKPYITSENAEIPYQAILSASNGIPTGVTVDVAISTAVSGSAVAEFPLYKAYDVTITGKADSAMTLTIPFTADLYGKGVEALDVDDLYIYNTVTGALIKANTVEGLTVAVGEGYYQITGVEGDSETTFVLAPTYNAPFWGSVWSILLIVLIVLVLLGGMMALGFFRLRRAGNN